MWDTGTLRRQPYALESGHLDCHTSNFLPSFNPNYNNLRVTKSLGIRICCWSAHQLTLSSARWDQITVPTKCDWITPNFGTRVKRNPNILLNIQVHQILKGMVVPSKSLAQNIHIHYIWVSPGTTKNVFSSYLIFIVIFISDILI